MEKINQATADSEDCQEQQTMTKSNNEKRLSHRYAEKNI